MRAPRSPQKPPRSRCPQPWQTPHASPRPRSLFPHPRVHGLHEEPPLGVLPPGDGVVQVCGRVTVVLAAHRLGVAVQQALHACGWADGVGWVVRWKWVRGGAPQPSQTGSLSCSLTPLSPRSPSPATKPAARRRRHGYRAGGKIQEPQRSQRSHLISSHLISTRLISSQRCSPQVGFQWNLTSFSRPSALTSTKVCTPKPSMWR